MVRRAGHIIELRGLEIGFRTPRPGHPSLSGPLNTSLGHGELVALMGINGSGKSTLLRTVAGLQKALGGEIRVCGNSLKDHSARELARILSYVSTDVVRVQGLRVRQLVAMGRYPHTGWLGSMKSGDHEKVRQALEFTSLASLSERDLDTLSDGERQRAMIARMLAQDTPVLLLDEPTAFLDLAHKYEIIRLLRNLSAVNGKCILFSTHDIQVALRESDKIWLMAGSHIIEGAPEDLVLAGSLDKALAGSVSETGVRLDMESGEFRLDREMHGELNLVATDNTLKIWTLRALERLGFRIGSNQTGGINVIAERKHEGHIWTVEKSGSRIELNSIYELSLYLKTKVKQN